MFLAISLSCVSLYVSVSPFLRQVGLSIQSHGFLVVTECIFSTDIENWQVQGASVAYLLRIILEFFNQIASD